MGMTRGDIVALVAGVRDHLYRSSRFRRIRFADSLTYAEKTSRASVRERCANGIRWWLNQAYAGVLLAARRLRVEVLLPGVRR